MHPGEESVCCKVKCIHCDADAEPKKECCDKPACSECDAFGKWVKGDSNQKNTQ